MSIVNSDINQSLINHIRNGSTDLASEDLMVPVNHFTCPERAQAEYTLLQKLPLIVAIRSELPEIGSFITRDVLGKPLLIVRQNDGRVQAYLNRCRHRGGKVETQISGRKRLFMCQYHGWSYDREGGALKSIPFEESFDKIDKQCNSLTPYKTDEHHGFIFVDFSNQQDRRIEDYLGAEVNEQFHTWEIDKSVVFIDKTFTLDMNWKLVMDGAIDIIHPQFLHADGVGKLIATNVGVYRNYGRHGQHFGARVKLKELIDSGTTLEGSAKYIGSNLVIYPNSMMIAAPDHVEFWTVWPSANKPGQCITQIRFLVREAILDDKIAARVNKSWEILEHAATKEDWPMERWIQENSEADPTGFYRYGRSEISAQHLHRQLSTDLDE